MKRTLTRWLNLGVLMLLLSTGPACDTNDTEDEPGPGITRAMLNPASINFGTVSVGRTDTAAVQAYRQVSGGTGEAIVYDIYVGRSYPAFYLLSDSAPESLITDTLSESHPTADFPVVFAPSEAGIYSSVIRLSSSSISLTDTVHLEGLAVDQCAFSRDRVEFGDVDVGTSRTDTFTVRNVTTPPGQHDVTVRLDIVGCDYLKFVFNGHAAYDWIQWTLAYGEAAVCSLQFTPPGAGEYSCALETETESYCGPILVTGTGAGASLGEWETCFSGRGPDLYAVHGSPGGTVYAVGDSGIVMFTDGPSVPCAWAYGSLSGIDTLSYRAVWQASGADAWVAGSDIGGPYGWTYIFGRQGFGWEVADDVPTMEHFSCGWGSSAADVYFMGLGKVSDHNGRHFDGTTWSNVLIDFGMYDVTGIWGSGPADVWAVMDRPSNNLWHFDGSVWEDRSEAWMVENLQDVWVDQGGEAFVVGTNGSIYHYDGSVWDDQSIGGSRTFYGVFGRSPSDVHVVGAGAALYHCDGFAWRAYSAPPGITVDLYDVYVHSDGEAHAVGQRRTVLRHPGS